MASNAAGAQAPSIDLTDRHRVAVPATLLALIVFTQLPSALTLTVTAPLLADMAVDLVEPNSSNYLVKLITGIIGPALIVGAPLAGWLADRFDRRPVLIALSSVFILTATAPAFLDSVEAIVVTRFFAGACAGGLSTVGMAMVGYYYGPDRRPKIIGTMAFLTLAISIVTLPIAGALAAGDWRPAFLIFLAMIPILLLAMLRPLPPPARTLGDEVGSKPENVQRLRIPAALLALACVNGLALGLPGVLYSFYFTELGVTKVGTISLILMYQAAVAGTMTLLFAPASARFSSKTIFMICLACAALGLGIQGSATHYWIAACALTFTGIAMGWLVPNMSATAIALVDPRHHGAAIGIIRAVSALATLIGIADPLQTALGIKGIFLGVASFCALVLIGLVSGALPLRRARA